MDAVMLHLPLCTMPIDGVVWSWATVPAEAVEQLLPLVVAVDPSGEEAVAWRQDALAWLAAPAAQRGIVSVGCMSGLLLALFFCSLEAAGDAATAAGSAACAARPGVAQANGVASLADVRIAEERRLQVERLRWLELARPHRSLDALLAIAAECGRRLNCIELLVTATAATEQTARLALACRAASAGLRPHPIGWYRAL